MTISNARSGGAGSVVPVPASTGILDWLFRDRRTGAIVVAQAPNPPLYVAGGAWLARLVVPSGGLDDALGWVVSGALVWWAVDEIVRGVNPWRRILGTAVLVVVVAGRVR